MKTQTERLRGHLDKGKSITRLNAYRELGIFELSARIVGLQKNGYQIKKEWIKVTNRYKETVSVVRYSKAVDIEKCVFCDNPPYKYGAAYCTDHMAEDDWN
jgi:hypothetical protein